MKNPKVFVFIILSFLILTVININAASRTALVVGNASYESSDVPTLENPVNDAADMADALRNLGFEVIEKINTGRRKMDNAVQQFYRSLNSAEVGLFYYAGHCMQIAGENFLIPVDIAVASPADIKFRAVGANWILTKMEDAKSRVNIVILDACRDNPFRGLKGGSQGLALIQSVRGSFVAYATFPGSVAQDGTGRNGVYTKHLLKAINRTGLTVEEMFREVRKAVAEETDYQQILWDSSSLIGAFYLAGGSAAVDTQMPEPAGKGVLKIWTEPAGAEIKVDSRFKGTSPLELTGLLNGSHTIVAQKAGYETQKKKVAVRAGRVSTVQFYMDKAKRTGRLYVHPTPADARVKIMNIVPPYRDGIALDPGRYQIRVQKAGYEPKEQWGNVLAGADLDVYIELDRKSLVSSGPEPGDTFTDPVTGMAFVWVEGGCFMMGSPLTGLHGIEKTAAAKLTGQAPELPMV